MSSSLTRFVLCLSLAVLASFTARAAGTSGQIISYQGYLRQADGRPVPDMTRDIIFRIYASADYDHPVYSETLSIATVAGKFSAFLNVGSLVFDPEKSYEVGTVIGAEELRQPIVSVPLALSAKTVSGATSAGNPNSVVQRDASGAFAAGAITYPDGSTQTTAYNPERVVRISPSPPQTISGTNGLRLRFDNVIGADQFLRFGLVDTMVSGDSTQRSVVDQFLLRADGGLLARGILGVGLIPATGRGERMMWYPFKTSFRVGSVSGTQWDDVNNGFYSFAAGYNPIASGISSIAMGSEVTAAKSYGIALGNSANAGETCSVAIGHYTTASGPFSTALGSYTTASGSYSTALGRWASTNGHAGSFVIGDNTGNSTSVVSAAADNQFAVRAQSIWLGKTSAPTATAGRYLETSTGAYLSSTGVWTNASSRALKTAFAPVNPSAILRKVVEMPITEWSYRANPEERHIGPMAQDFARAFQLGLGDEAIATVDADGVALAAIQGLHAELKARDARIADLEARLSALERRLAN